MVRTVSFNDCTWQTYLEMVPGSFPWTKKMEQHLVNNVEQINHLVAQTRCLKDHLRYLYYKDTAQIRCLKEMKYEKLKTTHSLIITEIA